MSIADNVRKASLNKTAENLPKGDNTKQLQEQLATGATGKGQAAGQNLKQSNIAEQIGMVNARGAQQDVAVQGLEAANQVAAKETNIQVQEKQVQAANRTQEMQHEARQADQMDSILSEIKYSETQLEDREDAAELEHVGRSLRLKDEKYRHTISQIGEKNRINETKRIAVEAKRLSMGNRTAELHSKLLDAGVLGDKKRASSERTQMDAINDALAIGEAAYEDDMNATRAGAITSVAMASGQGLHESGALKGMFSGDSEGINPSTLPQGTEYTPYESEESFLQRMGGSEEDQFIRGLQPTQTNQYDGREITDNSDSYQRNAFDPLGD